MPPIFLHMAVARDVASELTSSPLIDERGSYLLGATSPDIRVILNWDRERTHFFNLAILDHQDSVAGFFAASPGLRDAGQLSTACVAFVSGYISHLALDETWIQQVYRPYFGQLADLGGRVNADLMDRVLQFGLEEQRRNNPDTVVEIRKALQHCSLPEDAGFLDSATLGRWLEIAVEQTRNRPEWERFRRQSGQQLRAAGIESEADWSRFVGTIPQILQTALGCVSTAQVDAFLEQAREKTRQAIGGYLGVRT